MAEKPTASSEPKRLYLRRIRHNAALSRWESVKREEMLWLRPFKELAIDHALAYLDDLRKICEKASTILNERIGNDKQRMVCSGIRCGKNLEGLLPNGRPRYIAKLDFKDRKNPSIIRSIFFCSVECHNGYMRKTGGAMGGTG